MGYIKHHAILVTCPERARLENAHDFAKALFGHVSEIINSPLNGYASFFVAPDGSKEGWSDSDLADGLRKTLTDYLKDERLFDWAEIQYGDEMGFDCLIQSSHNFKGELP